MSNNLAGEENQAILFVILKQQKLKGKQQIINIILTLYSKGWGFLIRIRSVNRTKGVKLRFEYDHIAPSGFGVAPIKRVPTAMFSLVRIRPMFEQEAPK